MAPVKLAKFQTFDLGRPLDPWQTRHAEGKELRTKVPRESHGVWQPHPKRPDPIKTILADNKGRQARLIPLRMGRMAASPFTFLRGSASVMAADLAHTPITGISVIMDGDAHINNFGMYGTPLREVVFDINDFDETTLGPWEWDLKRLTASVNVAGRGNGLTKRERAAAVKRAVEGYRFNMRRLEKMGVLDIWQLHANPGNDNPIAHPDAKSQAIIRKTLDKALHTDNRALLPKVADQIKGANGTSTWRFRDDPPVLTTIDKATKSKVIKALNDYTLTIHRERRMMLAHYHVVDVAHRVVGVGSVGTRAYLALLFGNGDQDPLFLQVKEATSPAHAPYLPVLDPEFTHNGKRVVTGQRALQSSSDPMLGYTQIDGRPFYVRQMKNLKASIPVEYLTGSSFGFYAWACGAILARAHSRTGSPARIAGYCGNSKVLDEALANWAEAYGDQTEADHAALVAAIEHGQIKADRSEATTD